MAENTGRGLWDTFHRWIWSSEGKYGKRAAISSIASTLLPLIFSAGYAVDWPSSVLLTLVGAAAVSSAGSYAFNKANRAALKDQEQRDMDGLLGAMDTSLRKVHEAASRPPEDVSTIGYVDRVLGNLRSLLEPPGEKNILRVCVYKREDSDRQEEQDGEPDAPGAGAPAGPVTEFQLYEHDPGHRTDGPRATFRDDVQPGATFIPRVIEHGKYECSKPSEFAPDDDRYRESPAKYRSFVNLAIRYDSSVTAMMTCDATSENFFTNRRVRIIRAFSHLVRLALIHEGTPAAVKPPPGLELK